VTRTTVGGNPRSSDPSVDARPLDGGKVRYIHDRDSPVPPRRLCLRPRQSIPG
ncbi:unnamed protein product, partial [Ascophyllum nodosum]